MTEIRNGIRHEAAYSSLFHDLERLGEGARVQVTICEKCWYGPSCCYGHQFIEITGRLTRRTCCGWVLLERADVPGISLSWHYNNFRSGRMGRGGYVRPVMAKFVFGIQQLEEMPLRGNERNPQLYAQVRDLLFNTPPCPDGTNGHACFYCLAEAVADALTPASTDAAATPQPNPGKVATR